MNEEEKRQLIATIYEIQLMPWERRNNSIQDCMDEASVEYDKVRQRNEEWEREHQK